MLPGGVGEGCVTTFRRRQDIQKIVEMTRSQREDQCTWCSCAHFWLEGKFQPYWLPAWCLYPCFFPPLFALLLPSPLAVSLFLLFFFFPVFTWFSLSPFCPYFLLYIFPSSSHPIYWKERGDRIKHWSEDWQSWHPGSGPSPTGDLWMRMAFRRAAETCHSSVPCSSEQIGRRWLRL